MAVKKAVEKALADEHLQRPFRRTNFSGATYLTRAPRLAAAARSNFAFPGWRHAVRALRCSKPRRLFPSDSELARPWIEGRAPIPDRQWHNRFAVRGEGSAVACRDSLPCDRCGA